MLHSQEEPGAGKIQTAGSSVTESNPGTVTCPGSGSRGSQGGWRVLVSPFPAFPLEFPQDEPWGEQAGALLLLASQLVIPVGFISCPSPQLWAHPLQLQSGAVDPWKTEWEETPCCREGAGAAPLSPFPAQAPGLIQGEIR